MLSRNQNVSIHVLDGYDDASLDEAVWLNLLTRGETDSVFLTPWWQKAWWKIFGRGQLLLLGVFQNDEPVALASLFADGGMVFFTGSGGSDYLDFIGEIPDEDVLAELLAKVISLVPGFVGFRFYHVPDESGTGLRLQQLAGTLGLDCYDEGTMPCPAINLNAAGTEVARKKSLVRHQRFFEREGTLSIRHFRAAGDILPRLESFFEQHVARWAATAYPSLFLDPTQRRFYEILARSAGPTAWLRFTEVDWNDVPIAFHFGFNYRGIYMWYKPSFAIELAKRSPGEVLLRGLLLASMEEGAKVFDLGLGAEGFKERFATHTPTVRTWGLYPLDGTDVRIGSKRD